MKKIFLFAFLISLSTLVNAQSNVDSVIKKADTTIVSESEKLNKTKIEINNIQSKISDLIKQKEINQDQIAKLNKNISKLSEIRNISKTELAELDKAKSDLKKSLNKDSTILINLDKEIGDAKKKDRIFKARYSFNY